MQLICNVILFSIFHLLGWGAWLREIISSLVHASHYWKYNGTFSPSFGVIEDNDAEEVSDNGIRSPDWELPALFCVPEWIFTPEVTISSVCALKSHPSEVMGSCQRAVARLTWFAALASRDGITPQIRRVPLGLPVVALHVFIHTSPFTSLSGAVYKHIKGDGTFLLLESCFRSKVLWQSFIRFHLCLSTSHLAAWFSCLCCWLATGTCCAPSPMLPSMGFVGGLTSSYSFHLLQPCLMRWILSPITLVFFCCRIYLSWT